MEPEKSEKVLTASKEETIRILEQENQKQNTTINIAICALAACFMVVMFCICFTPWMI